MDELGPLNIEFVINNPEVIAQAQQVQATVGGLNENLEAQGKRIATAINAVMTAQVNGVANATTAATQQVNSVVDATYQKIEKLKIQLAEYQVKASVAPNIGALATYNQKIEEIGGNIARLGNVGKSGYDDLGNALEQSVPKATKFETAIARVTDISTIGARVVTQLSRQIISLGVGLLSGIIGAKALEYLVSYIANLDIFTGRLNQAKQNQAALNEVMAEADKTAGKQIGALKELYDAATNVNNSMQTRIAAAQALREEDAATFANATNLAIVNGKLKQSYDDLTLSIIAQAKSEAALSKIQSLEGTILDNQYKIDQNNTAKARATERAYKNYDSEVDYQKKYGTTGSGNDDPKNILGAALLQIKSEADTKNLAPSQNIAIAQKVVTNLESYVTGISKGTTDLANANKLLGVNLQNFNNLLANQSDKKDLDNIKAALQTKLDSLAPSDPQIKGIEAKLQQVDDLEKKYQVKPTKTQATDPATAILASQTSLQEKIQALKTEGQTKDKTRDEQEIDAVKAKYTAIYNEIVAQNLKYTNYLKTHTPEQAAAKGLVYTDPTSIKTDEDNAVAGVTGGQQLEQTKNVIAQQKALYQEYQEFKIKNGEDAANQLYGNEIGSYKTYLAYLRSLEPTTADLNSTNSAVKSYASQLSDYLNKTAIPAGLLAQQTAANKVFDKYIESTQSYEEKRKAIVEKYGAEIATLSLNYDEKGATQAANQMQAELEQQDAAQAQKVASFQNFSSSILNLTKEQAQLQIQAAKAANDAELAAGTIKVDTFTKIADAIKLASDELNKDKLANYFDEIGKSLSSLGGEVSKTNSSLGSIISTLGSTFTQITAIYDLSVKLKAEGGFMTALEGKDPASAFAVITDGLNAIIGLVNTLTAAAAQRKQAEQDYYNSVIAFQGAYNVALDEQIKLQYQTQGDVFYTNYAAQLVDASKAYGAATAQYQQSLVALQKGQAIVAQKDVVSAKNVASSAGSGAVAGAAIGSIFGGAGALPGAVIGGVIGAVAGLFGGKKSENVLTPLLQQYPQLIEDNGKFNESLAKTLIANNQVSDSTKVLLQNTINYYDEAQSAIDQINSALSSLAGSMGTNLESALVKAFEAGTSAFQAFQGVVSSGISDIVAQFLFSDIFGASLDKLNAALKATVLAGGTQADVTAGITQDFTQFYNEAGSLAGEYQQGLAAAQASAKQQGIALFDPTADAGSGSSTLTGQIKGITEAQANVLEGVERGIQLLDLGMSDTLKMNGKTLTDQLSEMRNQTLLQMQIVANTKRTADNTEGIGQSLINIDKNTSSGSLSSVLRAAGITK